MVKWIGTGILGVLSLPLMIGIVDMWWFVMFNKMLVLEHWSQQTFVAAIILAGAGFVAKLATIWMADQ